VPHTINRKLWTLSTIRHTRLPQTTPTKTTAIPGNHKLHTRQTPTTTGQLRRTTKETTHSRTQTNANRPPPTNPKSGHCKRHLSDAKQTPCSKQHKHQPPTTGGWTTRKDMRQTLLLGWLHKPNVSDEARLPSTQHRANSSHRKAPTGLRGQTPSNTTVNGGRTGNTSTLANKQTNHRPSLTNA